MVTDAAMPYDDLTDTQFEEFCFELMKELGFVNIDWRKGTGLNASPSDNGRDIVAERQVEEFDGAVHMQRWFVDCKKYTKGVPPDKITGLLTWASAERADVALIIASSFLSNPCKEYLKAYELNNRPPFRVKYWERPQLGKLLDGVPEFVARYVDARSRTEAEIVAAEEYRTNKLWYSRKQLLYHFIEIGQREPLDPKTDQLIKDAMRQTEEQYADDPDFLIPEDEQETWNVAYLLGELSALRWVLGDDWNNGDS
ncbi:restriction endonuclease [Streptomyces hokutonensis]|uniref:restriction endonuclease n=1 Tax=Streptomyces hokutonensis TaxID=1306990 RepID=UPI001FE218E5|nr:restriction endonuclease [Streptomyces hokutonensis]